MSTIRDVANLAQVSTATVSRVLNNDTTYKMTDQTREKVWNAVTQLNYTTRSISKSKNPVKANLTEKSFAKIGCILSITKKKFNDPFFMSILSGIETQLIEKGYAISFIKTGPEMENKEILFNTFNETITGLILMTPLSAETYEYIRQQVPYIVGIEIERDDIDNIGYDHVNSATMAVKHLIEKGHKTIGFIGSSDPNANMWESRRYNGYCTTMHNAGLSINPEWIIDCGWDEELCIEKMNHLIKTHNYPSAFFAASDLMAMAALSSLYDNGISVPDDIAIMGLSNIELSKYSNPPLSTIEVPTEEIGMIAADLLISKMNGDKLLPKKIILPTKLIKRSST